MTSSAARDEARKLAEKVRRKREDVKQIEKAGRSHRYKPVTITLADVDELLSALDALVALVERAERERDEAAGVAAMLKHTEMTRLREAEARVVQLQQEREEWEARAKEGATLNVELIRERKAAEQERDQLAEALERIGCKYPVPCEKIPSTPPCIRCAALAASRRAEP